MLTKSQFMAYMRCPVGLWLIKNRPDLVPAVDVETKRSFAMGNEVDMLAKQLFPSGTEISGYNHTGWENTQKAILNGAQIMFQPTAVTRDLSAKADIVTNGEVPATWDIREVKMNTEVKKENLIDLAFQKICFQEAGMQIDKTYLVHVNNQYVRNGDINVQDFLVSEDVTAEVNAILPEIKQSISEALKLLDDHTDFSDLLLQRCLDPLKCEFVGYCIKGYQEIYNIADKLPHDYLHALLTRGLLDDKLLNPELIKALGYIAPEPFHEVDTNQLKEELKGLVYPLYFIDYETYAPVIPPFDGIRPYQQIPFQFALYIKETPSSELKFIEFLAKDFKNPIPEFVGSMKERIGPIGSVIVWNQSFEAGRNKEMAQMLPEYESFLLGMNGRMFDLMLVFKFRRQIYTHSQFNGSASLKMVLPVVCPDLSYANLGIHNGGEATAAWPLLTDVNTPQEAKEKLANDLLEYCKLDTFAMVRILQHLEERLTNTKTEVALNN